GVCSDLSENRFGARRCCALLSECRCNIMFTMRLIMRSDDGVHRIRTTCAWLTLRDCLRYHAGTHTPRLCGQLLRPALLHKVFEFAVKEGTDAFVERLNLVITSPLAGEFHTDDAILFNEAPIRVIERIHHHREHRIICPELR